MAWSQSEFLQALGWATLNSFWQMGLLWCIYLLANGIFRLSAHAKYCFSVAAIIGGFIWFCISLILYKQAAFAISPVFEQQLYSSNNILNICLISASAAYLALLVFPAYRLFRNWRFVQRIKKDGLHKAHLDYRLYVQKLAAQLNIRKRVKVFVSDIVSSPVTIGYIKPVILLPVAALNNLSLSQVEAILLHELSHIKRFDYIVNLLISIIYTILYFNPFVKLFMNQVEAERENCCDELVLQYGYDRVSYASALLSLEKSSARHQVLALGVTGKKNLITRIEKIVGMEKRKRYSLAQLAPVFAAIICILMFNSFLIIKDGSSKNSLAFGTSTVVNPLYFIEKGSGKNTEPLQPVTNPLIEAAPQHMVASKKVDIPAFTVEINNYPQTPSVTEKQAAPPEVTKDFYHVAFDEVDASLTAEQKEQVKATVDATKKVLTTLQWQEVENSMADVLKKEEKALAKREYMKEVDAVNWKNVETNLKANYENIDWIKVNSNIGIALTTIQLDSIQKSYTLLLTQLEKAERQISSAKAATATTTPMPDRSLADLRKAKEDLIRNIEAVKKMKLKPVIRL